MKHWLVLGAAQSMYRVSARDVQHRLVQLPCTACHHVGRPGLCVVSQGLRSCRPSSGQAHVWALSCTVRLSQAMSACALRAHLCVYVCAFVLAVVCDECAQSPAGLGGLLRRGDSQGGLCWPPSNADNRRATGRRKGCARGMMWWLESVCFLCMSCLNDPVCGVVVATITDVVECFCAFVFLGVVRHCAVSTSFSERMSTFPLDRASLLCNR